MVVQGEDDLCGVLEVLDRGIDREDMAPNEEHKFQEGPEHGCPAVSRVLGVFTGPGSEA